MSDSPTLLFGQDGDGCDSQVLDGCVSPVFDVCDQPVLVRAFNLSDDDKIFVEMVAGDNDGEFFERMRSGCGCSVALSGCNNTLVLSASGRYRLNRCVCDEEPSAPLAHVEYQATTTGAVVNYGEVNMACACDSGSQVSVVQPGDGSTIVTVDGTPFVISPTPDVPEVSVSDLGDTVLLTVDGASYQIDKGPDTGASVAALLALRSCQGAAINAGDTVATCADLSAAVDAINTTIAGLSDVFLSGSQGYNPSTNTLTLVLNDGTTVPVDLTDVLADITPPPAVATGTAPPTAAPSGDDPTLFVDITTTPRSLYHWDGSSWNLVGDGTGAGPDGVITSAALDPVTSVLTVTPTVGPAVTVDLSGLLSPVLDFGPGYRENHDGTYTIWGTVNPTGDVLGTWFSVPLPIAVLNPQDLVVTLTDTYISPPEAVGDAMTAGAQRILDHNQAANTSTSIVLGATNPTGTDALGAMSYVVHNAIRA